MNTYLEVVQNTGGETISEEEVQFRKLDELIKSHNVVFALTDSREARFIFTSLPTFIDVCFES